MSLSNTSKNEYRLLYKLGGIAPIITMCLYLSQFMFISWDMYPESIEEWFALFNRSKLLGLFYLNSLDIISIGVLGIMFVAVCIRLRDDSKALTAIAQPFAFLGISVFIVPRTLLLSFTILSEEYLNAASEAELAQIGAAAKALSVIGIPTIQTAGFFIVSCAVLLLSFVMLKSDKMPKIAGIVGIAGFILTLIDDIFVLMIPNLATPMLIIAGIFWIVWWIIMSIALLRIKD